MQQAQEIFRQEALKMLEQKAKGQWQKYGFDLLLQTVLDILRIEKLPLSQINAKCGKLIDAKNAEVVRKKRLDDWNKKTENSNQSE